MNEDIQKMISKDIEFAKVIVECESKVSQKSYGVLSPEGVNMREASDAEVFFNLSRIIKVKARLKRV